VNYLKIIINTINFKVCESVHIHIKNLQFFEKNVTISHFEKIDGKRCNNIRDSNEIDTQDII